MAAKWSAVQQTLNPVVLGLSPPLRATSWICSRLHL